MLQRPISERVFLSAETPRKVGNLLGRILAKSGNVRGRKSAAEDFSQKGRLRFQQDLQLSSIKEDSAAGLRGAAIDEDFSIALFLERRPAFWTMHPVGLLLILGFQLGSLRFRLFAKLCNSLLVLAVEVLVFFAIALILQIIFHAWKVTQRAPARQTL